MPYWAYMIQCADRQLYVGHTNNLEHRWVEHQAGTYGGYTASRRPLHLVWSQEFTTRYEAVEAERRLKGWGRAKKLALIRGDWAAISALARGSAAEGRASTSSARTFVRVASSVFLHPHLCSPPSQPFCLEVRSLGSRLRFTLTGPIATLRIPPPAPPQRRDELWRHSCFEIFARTPDGYVEYNLSPSSEWAAYRFSGYREGMAPLDTRAPTVAVTQSEHRLEVTAELELPEGATALGLSAVLEEMDGRKTYWALRHPLGDTPDFHHPDCFALALSPAAEA